MNLERHECSGLVWESADRDWREQGAPESADGMAAAQPARSGGRGGASLHCTNARHRCRERAGGITPRPRHRSAENRRCRWKVGAVPVTRRVARLPSPTGRRGAHADDGTGHRRSTGRQRGRRRWPSHTAQHVEAQSRSVPGGGVVLTPAFVGRLRIGAVVRVRPDPPARVDLDPGELAATGRPLSVRRLRLARRCRRDLVGLRPARARGAEQPDDGEQESGEERHDSRKVTNSSIG